MYDTIVFLGAGRIARIMLGGLRRAGALPRRILVHDPATAAVHALQASFPGVEIATLAQAAGADLMLAALHPPALLEALPLLRAALRPTAVLCSLAPRVKLATMRERLGGFARLARQNPNAPSLVGAGYNPIAFDPGLPAEERGGLLALLAPLGQAPVVEEATLEAYAVISAMGPTYLWFQLQALRELAVSFGLSAAEADAGLKRMVSGAVNTLVDSGLAPADVMDLVPVKPLAEMEPQVLALYRSRLPALFQKIKP